MTDLQTFDDRDAWREWRRGGLGASDVAAVLGLSPYASPWSLWAEKTGLTSGDFDNELMEAGRWLELAIAPWFAHRTGLHVGGEQMAITHPHAAWARATVDGIVLEAMTDIADLDEALGGLEIKTAQPGRTWDEIPAHYQAQGQWQMHVADLPKVWFAVLHGRRLEIYVLDRDQDDIDYMAEQTERFWVEHVLAGVPPAVDGSDATLNALAELYPDHTPGSSVDIDDIAYLVASLDDARCAKKQAEASEKEAKALLADRLGANEEGLVGGKRAVSYRTQSTRRLDGTSLRKAHPTIAAEFTTESTSRVMRTHTTKEK